jgi:hypothetical protein
MGMFRKSKLTATKWLFASSIRQERFRNLLSSDSMKDVFNDKFFEKVDKRLSELESRQLKIMAFGAVIFGVLALSLIPLKVQFSFFGITPTDTKGLREVLVLVGALLGLVSSTINREMGYLKEMLRARIDKQAGKNEDAKKFLSLPYGLAQYYDPVPDDPHLKSGFARVLLTIVSWALQVLIVLALIGALVLIQLTILVDIYRQPSISREFSIGVIAVIVMFDLLLLSSWYMREGLVPFQTDEWQRIFRNWQSKEPRLYALVMEVAQLEHNRKGVLRRLLGRPTPIKVAKRLARQSDKK